MGNKVIDGANVSLNDAFAQIHLTRTTVELAEGIMNRLWNLLDQVCISYLSDIVEQLLP